MASSRRIVVPGVIAAVAAIALTTALLAGAENPETVTAVQAGGTSESAPDPEGEGRRELGPFTVAVQDFNYGNPGHSATRDKAQSKLWHHDGSWWATMIDPFTDEVHIFELQDSTWVDTGVFVDARGESNADVVWTGSTLYIASRTSTGELLLQRYTYGPDRRWVPAGPSPTLIAEGGGQSLTIAVDSQDRVWASWVDGNRMWVANSAPGGFDWGPPVTPPGGEDVQDDDATDIAAFGGRIGVLWSNQSQDSFFWSSRDDTQPVTVWDEQQTVRRGVNIADGHVNLAVSSAGEVYAAVKTSLGDNGEPSTSTLIEVLHRQADGSWTSSTAATVGNQMTRAQLLITADGEHLILVATSPQAGGALYYKIADAADIRFAPGKGSLLLGWEGAIINDPTTTQAPIDPSIPLVVLASDSGVAQYYHAELSLQSILSGR